MSRSRAAYLIFKEFDGRRWEGLAPMLEMDYWTRREVLVAVGVMMDDDTVVEYEKTLLDHLVWLNEKLKGMPGEEAAAEIKIEDFLYKAKFRSDLIQEIRARPEVIVVYYL